MVVLLQLNELSRQGNWLNWNIDDEDDLLDQLEELPSLEEDVIKCPTNICIICCGLSYQSLSNPSLHEFPHN